jgi:hypothetical protein
MWQKAKGEGTSDQTTNYNQFNAGQLATNVNSVQAGLGARDSIDALAQQPGMGWVSQINSDPKLAGKVDWVKVEEAHTKWDYKQQGLTPEGAAIVTLVAAYFTAGTASGWGASAGTAVGGGTTGAVFGGAVTAGVTALASQVALAVINNRGNLADTLHDLGSSENVKSLVTAIITGGVLAGLSLNPTGLPGGGEQTFFIQLQQNLTAGVARAVIDTAINGGSFEKNLAQRLEMELLNTTAAQTAFAIGDARVGISPALNEFTAQIAHAVAGCAVGAGRAVINNGGFGNGCSAGAIGAVVGNLAADFMLKNGTRDSTSVIAFSQLIGGIASAATGGDSEEINIASQAGANAAANNELLHLGSRVEALTRSGYTLLRISLPGYGDAYVDPRMATALQGWVDLAAMQGVNITFNSAFRGSGQPVSGAVYTPAGDNSLHNAGLAVDVRYGRLQDIPGGLTATDQQRILRDTASQAGLSWGGNFSQPDTVHFYIDPYGRPGSGRTSLIQTQQDAFNFLNGK